MNEKRTDSHPSDDLAAYALGALEPGEEAEVRAHLDGCERCRAELEWLRPAVDVLPASVPQLDPPRRLRRELMRTVRADARAERGSWWRWRPGWITMRARPALMVAAAALLVAGIAGYIASEANRGGSSTVTNIHAEIPEPLPEGLADASAVLETGEGQDAVLRVSGMPELEGEDVYQLWFADGAAVEPASAFTVGAGGEAEADVGAIPPGTDEVLVTQEAKPDLPAPKGEVLIRAPLA